MNIELTQDERLLLHLLLENAIYNGNHPVMKFFNPTQEQYQTACKLLSKVHEK